MRFYPVFIPTLNRFVHFRECVESLANCTHADKTELVIGLDYPPSEKYVEGYKLIKNFIPSIQGFAKVTVFEHQKNLGPCENWKFLVRYCESNYDAYIGTEDDNQVRGCIAYYLNEEGRFVYISHYWVDAGVQRLHYGSRMLQELVFINGDYYQEILLEVTKSNPALRFYLNNGFTIKENRTEKYLLSLLLKGETCQNHH